MVFFVFIYDFECFILPFNTRLLIVGGLNNHKSWNDKLAYLDYNCHVNVELGILSENHVKFLSHKW